VTRVTIRHGPRAATVWSGPARSQPRATGVRSYRDSAAAALEYALTRPGAESVAEIEVWSV
jgi:hypothetical protein